MNKKLRLAFLIGLLVLIVNSIVPFVLAQRVAQRQATADQIAADVSLLRRLLGAYKDTETGERGFILSGRSEFLEPYIAGRGNINLLLPEITQSLTGTQSDVTIRSFWQLDQQYAAYQREQISRRGAGQQPTETDFERGKQYTSASR